MPSKSGRGRRWRPPQSKRKKGRRSPPAAVIQQQIAAPTHKVASPSKVSAPSVGTSAPGVAPTPARYPYVVSELRRTGILAGIILVTLVILAVVLP